jgi:hypothetical protein
MSPCPFVCLKHLEIHRSNAKFHTYNLALNKGNQSPTHANWFTTWDVYNTKWIGHKCGLNKAVKRKFLLLLENKSWSFILSLVTWMGSAIQVHQSICDINLHNNQIIDFYLRHPPLVYLYYLDFNTSVIHTTIYAFIISTFKLTTCFDTIVSSSGVFSTIIKDIKLKTIGKVNLKYSN